MEQKEGGESNFPASFRTSKQFYRRRNGFPTSIADFLVKNHRKIKFSKKKHRSKPTSSFVYDLPSPVNLSPFSRSVSDSPANLPKLDMPTCSIDANSNLYTEENIARRNPNSKSNGNGYNSEYEIGDYTEIGRASNSNYKSIWLLILKGVVVLIVGLYTKSFVFGVSIGAFFFCILEYLWKSIFGFFNPCEYARLKPQELSKSRKMVDNKRNVNVGLKRELESDENGVISREIELKLECKDSQKMKIIEIDGFASMAEIEFPESCNSESIEFIGEVSEIEDDHNNANEKTRKRKFWKKFVPLKPKKKKKKKSKREVPLYLI